MMSKLAVSLILSLFVIVTGADSNLKVLTPEQAKNVIENGNGNRKQESQFATQVSKALPPDNGGNYGDLVYRRRENGDTLLLREVVILDELSSSELDVQWWTSLKARRISSVRVLNIGRERAFCVRIDVAGADAQAVLRIRPLFDPRVLIEVYGF